jgi:hypothetical protein
MDMYYNRKMIILIIEDLLFVHMRKIIKLCYLIKRMIIGRRLSIGFCIMVYFNIRENIEVIWRGLLDRE